MKILITGVGGPTPRSIATALKFYGSNPAYELIGTDCDRLAIGLYQTKMFAKTCLVPGAAQPNYWPAVEKIVGDHKIDLAIVQPEEEVLEWSHRAKERGLPCKALIPDFDLVKLLLDKSLVNETLAPLGIAPRSVKMSRDRIPFDEIEKTLGYPFWIRGLSGSSGLGSLKVENRQMFEGWLLIQKDIKQFLASKYLPGRNLACKLLYFEGELIRSACAERVHYIMSKISPSGITGNTSFGRLLSDPAVFEAARTGLEALMEKMGAKKHGFFTVDLKEDKDGKPLVSEVNVRHVAFTSCFAAAGANLAEDSVRLVSGDQSFDKKFKMYEFKDRWAFLRDVDSLPVIVKESSLI